MAFSTLREFLEILDKEGQRIRIEDEVRLELDLGAAGRAISNVGKDAATPVKPETRGHYDRPLDSLHWRGLRPDAIAAWQNLQHRRGHGLARRTIVLLTSIGSPY